VSERFRCAASALARHEPRFATASTIRRWLLIEQPGPWGRDAVVDNRMPPATGHALADLGKRLPARVLLIRRRGGRRRTDRTRVYVAVTGVRVRWLESFAVDTPEDVLGLDLSGLADGRSVGGTPEAEPLLLVCTNGRHDPCCAEFGRPVAAALDATFGDQVWEVSHIGGDRFAGNVVVLPDGLYFGGLDAERAVAVARSHAQGRIDLDTYRGRSAYPFVVQAAEYFLRRERHLDGVDDVRWTARRRLADDRWRIVFHTPSDTVAVDLTTGRDVEPRRLTCAAERTVHPPRFELRALHTVGAEHPE
jgi:hypothetical protein